MLTLSTGRREGDAERRERKRTGCDGEMRESNSSRGRGEVNSFGLDVCEAPTHKM